MISPKQLHILQHALGCDKFGNGSMYRNRYVTGPESDDFADCSALSAAGLMRDHGAQDMFGGMHGFTVTSAGIEAMKRESPKAPKISRGKLRYRAYLRADCGLSFLEWLRAYGSEAAR